MDVSGIVGHLETAVMEGRTDVIRAALSDTQGSNHHIHSGIDSKLMDALNTVKPAQGTMLHVATKLGNADVVRALLVSEVDASIRDESGATAFEVAETSQVRSVFYDVLLQAIGQSKTSHVQKLLSCGLDVNHQDSSTGGNSILHWAAMYGNMDILKLLLAFPFDRSINRAHLNQVSTPTIVREHVTADKSGRIILKSLINTWLDRNAKCNVNAVNGEGMTALHEAVLRKDAKLVEELLVRGADQNIEAKSGKHAGKSSKALAAANPEIVALMEKAAKVPLRPVTNDKAPTIEEKTLDDVSISENGDLSDPTLSSPPTPSGDTSVFSPIKTPNGVVTPMSEASKPEPVAIDKRLELLWPKPQHIVQKEGSPLLIPQQFTIRVLPSPSGVNLEKQVDIWTIQSAMMQDLGLKPSLESGNARTGALVVCIVNQQLFQKRESYRIAVRESQIELVCRDISGLWYASCTLLNLIRLCGKDGIPQIKISDWPSLAHRGVLLDMSAGRIQTIDHLLFQINTLSVLKFNELHFHMKVGNDSTLEKLVPYLPCEMLDMEVYCHYRFMSVVPHIDAMPGLVLNFKVFDLFRKVLSLFSNNRFVNIGPLLTSKLINDPVVVTPEGADQVGVTMSLAEKLQLMGVRQEHTLLLCANEKLPLPLGSIAVQYGTRDTSDFSSAGQDLSGSGMGFLVAPGTATWNSIGGSPQTAIRNILNANHCCATNGDAIGLLVVKWAGKTFLDHSSLAWPGLVTASGCAWNTRTDEAAVNSSLAAVINYLVYQDPDCPIGDVIYEVGRACTLLNRAFKNAAKQPSPSQPLDGGSFLCQLVMKPDDVDLSHMTAEVAQKVMLKMRKCQGSLKKGSRVPYNAATLLELYLVADLVLWGAKLTRSLVIAGSKPKDVSAASITVVNPGIANLTATTKTDCANKLLSMMDEYRHVWLKSCHSSGLLESLTFFETILEKLVPQKST